MNAEKSAEAGAVSTEPVSGEEVTFLDRLRGCVEQRRADGHSLALLLADFGVIGRIDALWGYQTGDAVRSRMVAGIGAEVLRPGDFTGDLGRDELACVLPVVESAQLAQLAAEKLLRTMSAPLWLGEAEVYASPSVGIAIFPAPADGVEPLLQHAKSACTAAAGKDGHIAFYDHAQDSENSRLVEEGRLRSAIADDLLELVFQPQFDLRYGQIMGVEAMLRWHDGERALVPMREAIAAADAGGMVTKLISSLLNRALRNCSELRQRAGLDLRVAVNLPARTLLNPEIAELVERALRTWSLRPGRLMLEIGDLAILETHEPARAQIKRLNEIGVKLSMDDSDAPLSSLFWLATLPFQELKIDVRIAHDWAAHPQSEGVFRSLVELVHKLKFDVVAIGVTDEAEAARILELGCDFMQADFRGPPVSPEDFITRFAS
ncbi:MAG: EAL domain-containing protein [Burkholderiales bacterium]|nr:EAL domain-containing protein [Burkholderiales bacterium]